MDWCNDECDDIWANSDYSVGCVGASSRGARCIPSRESVAVARARSPTTRVIRMQRSMDGQLDQTGWA
jgi:hypothetical protein